LHNDLTQSRTDHPSTTQTSTLSLHDALPIYTECQPPAITGTTSSTSSTPMCMYDTATLTATADAGATINWYDAPTGGTAVGTGATFTTPALAASTQYYVSASTGTNYAVGPINPNSLSGGALTTAITTYYIEFEVSN